MSEYEYQIEKHVKTEWIVTCTRVGSYIRTVIAKCNTKARAQTIKEMLEYKYDREDKEDG